MDNFFNSSYYNYNNKERKLSLETLIITNRSSLSSSLNLNDSLKQQNNNGLLDSSTNSFSIKPCTIQYMSAYNIYEPIDSQCLEDTKFDTKHLCFLHHPS